MTGRGRGSDSHSSGNKNSSKEFLGTIQPDLFTRRPGVEKQGTCGVPQMTYANFIPIDMEKPDSYFFQYNVTFTPAVDSKHTRETLLRLPTVTEEIGQFHVFDGMILYLTKEWERTQTLEVTNPSTGEPVAITFKFTQRYGLDDPQTINTFNTIIRRCFDQIGLTQLGRNYFDKTRKRTVREYNMDVLPGYETAIRRYEDQLMLCVENRFKMVRRDSMLEMIQKEFNQNGNSRMRTEEKMNELYGGSTIVTFYNNKLHRFTRLDFNITPLSEFEKDGEAITLKDYFKNQYNKDIRNLEQPIIISEGKPKQPGEAPQVNYLVPELCFPTGLTDEMRKDFRIMKELASQTRLSPQQRCDETRSLIKRFHEDSSISGCLNYWGIKLGNDLATVRARVLPPQKLTGQSDYQGKNAEWAKHVKDNGLHRPANIENWIVVGPCNGNSSMLTKKFIDECQRLGRQMKVPIANPLSVPINGIQGTDYLEAIRETLKSVEGHEIHCIVIMLADDNKTRYDSLKKYLCVECPIPSQCVNLRTLAGKASDGGENKNFSSIVLKIVLQMVCKAGGALWKVNLPLKKTMIVGYDLYHDSTMKGKTVGACVSTTSDDFTKFYSQTRPHENPTQLGTNLVHFIRKALKEYYDVNEELPERLILYRDGAGDGQIQYINNTEVRLVREACTDVTKRATKKSGKPAVEIKFAFIIVTKKVNMRILKRGNTSCVNPEPGTVVDSVVTRPERMDFYLVPQMVNQGTVTPVAYNIIFDETDLNADKHQQIAFKLCHMYYNWQGTVRVPAPCQYAHKLAFLTAQSLHAGTHEQLRNKLFYL